MLKRFIPASIALLLLAALSVIAFAAPPKKTTKKPASKTPSKTATAAPTTKPAPAAAPKTERPVPFGAGETLGYDVSWSTYLTAGTATVTVREKKPSFGSTAYYIVAEGQPTPLVARLYTLYYKADTLMDVYTLLPQRGSVYSDEGGHKRMKVTRFDQGARAASYEVQTATLVKRSVPVLPYTQDALSAFYVMRAIPMKPGAKLTIPVTDSGETYKVEVSVGQRELVKTGLGSVNAWKVTPAIFDLAGKPETTRHMALWISDDDRRLPVKVQADLAVGSFNLTLREARPGSPPAAPAKD